MQSGSIHSHRSPILVLAGNGKTGRRVVQRLRARGVPTRVGSRSGTPPFDWDDPSTWPAALHGVRRVYVAYTPDLAVTAAPTAIRTFTELAAANGIERLVLISGRGEEEAQRCEAIVRGSGVEWAIVRASWFAQNFSEGAFRELVLSGVVSLPAGDVGEPFIDADDIADVAVAALTEDRHVGQVYEVTGPRLLTFAEAVGEIAAATGRELSYARIPMMEFAAALRADGVPEGYVELLEYIFSSVLDGRNAHVTDGVQQALGRPPRDFREFAKRASAEGAWSTAERVAEPM